MANILGLSSLSVLDQKLLELPVRSAGLGIPSIIPRLPGAFLAAHLLMVQFLRRAYYAPDHFLNIAIARAYLVPASSSYAHSLSSALNVFSELYASANGRPHEPILDGFHMSLEGLGKIADKFQHSFSLLLAMVQVPGVVQSLSPYQRVTFKSNRATEGSFICYHFFAGQIDRY